MPKITNEDHNALVELVIKTTKPMAKRLRIWTARDRVQVLMKLINKYWKPPALKTETAGTGKEQYVRCYFNSNTDRDIVLAEIQDILSRGQITYGPNGYQDQNGTMYKDDGTPIGNLTLLDDEKKGLIAGVSNNALIIGALVIIVIVLLIKKRN